MSADDLKFVGPNGRSISVSAATPLPVTGGGGGGGTGDASAAKQDAQTALLTTGNAQTASIRDNALPAVPAGYAITNTTAAATLDLGGRDTVGFQVTGTPGTLVLVIEGSNDGTNWVQLGGSALITNLNTGATSATVTANGIYKAGVGGIRYIRFRATTATGTSITVAAIAVDGNTDVAIDQPLPAGSAAIGSVVVSSAGTITPGTAAGNLGKAEDAAHASGDTGVGFLAVRNDNAATDQTSANGDYGFPAVDIKGAQFVRDEPSTAGTVTRVAASTTNVTLKAANAARRGLTVFNRGTQILYLKLGATASITSSSESYTMEIPAGGYYEVPAWYNGIVDGIWAASATGYAQVTELA